MKGLPVSQMLPEVLDVQFDPAVPREVLMSAAMRDMREFLLWCRRLQGTLPVSVIPSCFT